MAPALLEGERLRGSTVLSWQRPIGAVSFRLFRSELVPVHELPVPEVVAGDWLPTAFSEIGTAGQTYFVDADARSDRPYHYYVVAENVAGTMSRPSNLVRVPSLSPTITVSRIRDTLAGWAKRGRLKSPPATATLMDELWIVSGQLAEGDYEGALGRMEMLQSWLRRHHGEVLQDWHAQDLDAMLSALVRRIRLAEAGLLDGAEFD